MKLIQKLQAHIASHSRLLAHQTLNDNWQLSSGACDHRLQKDLEEYASCLSNLTIPFPVEGNSEEFIESINYAKDVFGMLGYTLSQLQALGNKVHSAELSNR